MKNEIITLTLPAIWASYLINNDASALQPEEVKRIDDFLKICKLPTPVSCSDESRFSWHHDANVDQWRGKGGDVLDYTFLVPIPELKMMREVEA